MGEGPEEVYIVVCCNVDESDPKDIIPGSQIGQCEECGIKVYYMPDSTLPPKTVRMCEECGITQIKEADECYFAVTEKAIEAATAWLNEGEAKEEPDG